MTHPPRAGMCQGNFAAVVKKILPIDECGVLAAALPIARLSREIAEDS
jgi:hypothetical protein